MAPHPSTPSAPQKQPPLHKAPEPHHPLSIAVDQMSMSVAERLSHVQQQQGCGVSDDPKRLSQPDEILPAESIQRKPPTVEDLSAIPIKDRVIALVANGMAGLAGPLESGIKEAFDQVLERGEYSSDARLMAARLEFIADSIPEIIESVQALDESLRDEGKRLYGIDVEAVLKAAQAANENTADPTKREMLRRAMLRSFDPEQFRTGYALHFMGVIGKLHGEDVNLLAEVCQRMGGRSLIGGFEIVSDWHSTLAPLSAKRLKELELIYTTMQQAEHNNRRRGHTFLRPTPLGLKLLEFLALPELDNES